MSDALSNAVGAERRVAADRPSPAMPLLVMAAVVLGAIAMALLWPREVIPADNVVSESTATGFSDSDFALTSPPAFSDNYLPGLIYWTVASALAFVVIVAIARRQGYRGGIWVNRRPLLMSGMVGLAAAIIVMFSQLAPGNLLSRGYLPVVAMAVAVVIWGLYEHRPALWIFGIAVTALAVTVNLYNLENLLFRLGMPGFSASIDVVNLAVVAAALLLGSAGFALAHAADPRHASRATP